MHCPITGWAYKYGGVLASDRVYGIILLHEKFLQFDWLRAVVFQLNLKYIPTCENYKPFVGSSINK